MHEMGKRTRHAKTPGTCWSFGWMWNIFRNSKLRKRRCWHTGGHHMARIAGTDGKVLARCRKYSGCTRADLGRKFVEHLPACC